MSVFQIKVPRKLQRVKILRPDEVTFEDTDVFPEIEEIPEEDDFVFDEDLLNEIVEEAIVNTPKLVENKFKCNFSLKETSKPISIIIDKLPEDAIPVAEVEIEVQSAYEKGFQDGQQLTRTTFETEISKLQEWVKNIDKVAENLTILHTQKLRFLEDQIVSLAVMVAEHILEKEITANSEIVIEQTKKAISSIENEKLFTIHLNPDDVSILEEVKSHLVSNTSQIETVNLIADSSIDKGGCLLETSSGDIDARIKTQLEKLKNALSKVNINGNGNDYTE